MAGRFFAIEEQGVKMAGECITDAQDIIWRLGGLQPVGVHRDGLNSGLGYWEW